MKYKNSCYGSVKYAAEFFTTNATPINYNGFQIVPHGREWHGVLNGTMILWVGSLRYAKANIDYLLERYCTLASIEAARRESGVPAVMMPASFFAQSVHVLNGSLK